MPSKKYKVNLSEEEKLHLQAVLRKGKSAARKQKKRTGSRNARGQVANQNARGHKTHGVTQNTRGQKHTGSGRESRKIAKNRSVLSITPNNDWRHCSQEQRLFIMDLTLIVLDLTLIVLALLWT